MTLTMRAAFVIARRDFTALIRSRAFLFFLLGPLVMFGIALVAGGLGSRVVEERDDPVIAVMMERQEAARIVEAAHRLRTVTDDLPRIEVVAADADPVRGLRQGRGGRGYQAVIGGSVERPILYATANNAEVWAGRMRFLLAEAGQPRDLAAVSLTRHIVPGRGVAASPDPLQTAQAGQMVLFLLTMLLAGMVLSNLVEEKANKIIEILAASIPMESIFLGKLFAMLAMAWLGICVWAGSGALILYGLGAALPVLPTPAVGWPVFLGLGVLYFSTAYLLFGSLFLGIGGMGATVRDVQTLSMPVTMGHLGVFMFATYTLTKLGQPVEVAAAIFPFSSPFVMLARAAQQPSLWPQGLALLWQCLCTWFIIRAGTAMFRRTVLKSGGPARRSKPA